MTIRDRLLVLVHRISDETRVGPDGPMSYPHAVWLLEDIDDTLRDIIKALDAPTSGLSGTPNGYLPARHPAKRQHDTEYEQ